MKFLRYLTVTFAAMLFFSCASSSNSASESMGTSTSSEVVSTEFFARDVASDGLDENSNLSTLECTGESSNKKKIFLNAEVYNTNTVDTVAVRKVILKGMAEFQKDKVGKFSTTGLIEKIENEKLKQEMYVFSFGHEQFRLQLPTNFLLAPKAPKASSFAGLISSEEDSDSNAEFANLKCKVTKISKKN